MYDNPDIVPDMSWIDQPLVDYTILGVFPTKDRHPETGEILDYE